MTSQPETCPSCGWPKQPISGRHEPSACQSEFDAVRGDPEGLVACQGRQIERFRSEVARLEGEVAKRGRIIINTAEIDNHIERQLSAATAEIERLRAFESELGAVHTQLTNVADDAFGPFPTEPCAKLIEYIERGLLEMRKALTNVAERSSPDDLRALGWSVAVHNDYRLDSAAHTFWLLSKDGRCVKGEGQTDAEALDEIRRELGALSQPAPAPAPGKVEALARKLRDAIDRDMAQVSAELDQRESAPSEESEPPTAGGKGPT